MIHVKGIYLLGYLDLGEEYRADHVIEREALARDVSDAKAIFMDHFGGDPSKWEKWQQLSDVEFGTDHKFFKNAIRIVVLPTKIEVYYGKHDEHTT